MNDQISSEELLARFAFWRVSGVGPALMAECLKYFGSIQLLFEQLKELPAPLQTLIQKADWRGAEKDFQWLNEPGHHLVILGEKNYPKVLAEISNPPPFLFVRGDVAILNQKQVAIVGSRNPTHYGIKITQLFAHGFATAGLAVASGLALGIDAIAHEAVLKVPGKTIAVLAVGLDQVYPKRHQTLAENILQHGGALVGEFGVGTKPVAENFPRRNRIISGLSLGVLVAEATVKSGSLITARYALEQGREVFAVPGSIFQTLSQGCHALIKQGAVCVEKVADVLEALSYEIVMPATEVKQNKIFPNLTTDEHHVLKLLSEMPREFEDLLAQLAWPSEKLQICLMQLRFQGLIDHDWSGYVIKS
ncbi:MAG: putative processing protein DprA [Gammaproteobacteria bacterium]|jgi:DNA processing protein|nr:putative processing protein DprA [Gammaproteobacteria bacterium]